MEATKSSKPPERKSDLSGNWREKGQSKKSKIESRDEDEEEEHVPAISKKRGVKIAEHVEEIPSTQSGIELPYKSVKPLNTVARTPAVSREEYPFKYLDPGSGEKSYRIRAPIQREGLADELIARIHNTEVAVKLGDLLGISQELREEQRTKLTRVRQKLEPQESVQDENEIM